MSIFQQDATEVHQRYSVIVTYSAEDETFYAEVPALGFVTNGDSIDHAFEMAEDAIVGRVQTLRDLGREVPIELIPAEVRQISV